MCLIMLVIIFLLSKLSVCYKPIIEGSHMKGKKDETNNQRRINKLF